MRITDNMRYQQAQRSISNLQSRHAEATRKASTGQRLGNISDDPVSAAELVRIKAALESTSRMQTTVRDARGDVELAEGALAESGGLFQRAREIAMQASNGTLSASDRTNMAAEVAGLREQLLSLGNTQGTRGYIFAGSQTDTAAFDAGGAFQGDALDHVVEIAPGVTAQVSINGGNAFSIGGMDAFTALEDLETALGADNLAGITSSLTNIDQVHSQLLVARGNAGLILSRLDTAGSALDQSSLLLSKHHSAVGEADPFEALSELSQLSTVLEQAIAVARETLNASSGAGLL